MTMDDDNDDNDDNYVDFELIETNRITFYRELGTVNTYNKYARGKEPEKVAAAAQRAVSLLDDLERDYARDIANMRRRLANATAGRDMDDNG
jgi:hypothetical protein